MPRIVDRWPLRSLDDVEWRLWRVGRDDSFFSRLRRPTIEATLILKGPSPLLPAVWTKTRGRDAVRHTLEDGRHLLIEGEVIIRDVVRLAAPRVCTVAQHRLECSSKNVCHLFLDD